MEPTQFLDNFLKILGVLAAIITPVYAFRQFRERNRAKERARILTMREEEIKENYRREQAILNQNAQSLMALNAIINEMSKANANTQVLNANLGISNENLRVSNENQKAGLGIIQGLWDQEEARIQIRKKQQEMDERNLNAVTNELKANVTAIIDLKDNFSNSLGRVAQTNLVGYKEALNEAVTDQKKNGDKSKDEILKHIDEAKTEIEGYIDQKIENLRQEILKLIVPVPPTISNVVNIPAMPKAPSVPETGGAVSPSIETNVVKPESPAEGKSDATPNP